MVAFSWLGWLVAAGILPVVAGLVFRGPSWPSVGVATVLSSLINASLVLCLLLFGHRLMWPVWRSISLIVAGLTVVGYWYLRSTYDEVISDRGDRTMVRRILTKEAESYKRTNPTVTLQELIDNANQRRELVYHDEPVPWLHRLSFICWVLGLGGFSWFIVARATAPKPAAERLYPVGNHPAEPRFNVIFVHGVEGHYQQTWQCSREQGNYWPQWVAEAFPEAAVWSFHYNAALSRWTGRTMPLVDRAANLLFHLQTEGPIRPTVFIAHSFGGLVVKKLWRSARDQHRANIVESIKGVIFLATPHSGATLATYVTCLPRILTQSTATLKELERAEPNLRDLNQYYRANPIPKSFVYHETQSIRGVLVVDASSADPGIAGLSLVPIDADHISICKPASRESVQVKGINAHIREIMGIESTV